MKDTLETACSSRKYNMGSISGDLAGAVGLLLASLVSCSVASDTYPALCNPPEPLLSTKFSGQEYGVGCHVLP